MVDPELDGAPQDATRGVGIARRPEDAGACELHRAEPDALDRVGTEGCGPSHRRRLRYARTRVKMGGDFIGTRTTAGISELGTLEAAFWTTVPSMG